MSIQYVHLEVDVRNHSSPVVRSRQKMHNAHTAHVLRQRATSPRNFNGWNGNPPITNYRVKRKREQQGSGKLERCSRVAGRKISKIRKSIVANLLQDAGPGKKTSRTKHAAGPKSKESTEIPENHKKRETVTDC